MANHSEFMNKIINQENDQLYYSPEQVDRLKLFSNNQDEENVNYDMLRMYMDLNKIAQTIDTHVLSGDISSNTNEHYVLLDGIKIRNISNITKDEILNSKLLKTYSTRLRDSGRKINLTLKQLKIDINEDHVIRLYPIFPYFAQFAYSSFMSGGDASVNNIILSKENYKNTDINSQGFENRVSYIKSQLPDITISNIQI